MFFLASEVDRSNVSFDNNTTRRHESVIIGGTFKPTECLARHKVAIVVPYRDRPFHLAVFANHMHPFLQRQQLEYTIFVIEQSSINIYNHNNTMIPVLFYLFVYRQFKIQSGNADEYWICWSAAHGNGL